MNVDYMGASHLKIAGDLTIVRAGLNTRVMAIDLRTYFCCVCVWY
jgi:hypothetical protein